MRIKQRRKWQHRGLPIVHLLIRSESLVFAFALMQPFPSVCITCSFIKTSHAYKILGEIKKDLCIQRDMHFTYRFQKPFGIFLISMSSVQISYCCNFFFFKPLSYCNLKNNLSYFAFILRLIFALLFHQEKLDSNNF